MENKAEFDPTNVESLTTAEGDLGSTALSGATGEDSSVQGSLPKNYTDEQRFPSAYDYFSD